MERHTLLADVIDLFARYCHHIDDGDFEEWSRLFLPHGVFSGPDRAPVEGWDALQRFAGSRRLDWPVRHLTYNVALRSEVRDTTPFGVRSDFHMLILDPSGPRIGAVGIYYDTLVRTSDGLRFAQRVVARLH